ncbi:MAG TPA: YbhB/YbcL family Raf kinase inhibitor-like protein [Bryobacteraceae bacterium]|nr:YbhB/YbcL family Raf kinase inhibitor-like protein [Bryobacteraceae bacterium]
MKRLAICTILLAVAAAAQDKGKQKGPAMPGLTLTTSAFEDGGIVPARYTMNDPNAVSPKLEWSHVPANTVTFALILHDPDVSLQRKNDDVLHWMIFNIPGSATELPEGIPAGKATLDDGSVQAKNLRGQAGYMGPGAPPQGPVHHYTFELYALDIKLDLGPDATRADVLKAMDGHILGKGVLVGRFHR